MSNFSENVRTKEFKLILSSEQERTLEDWMLVCKWVWNRSLGLIEEFNEWNPYDKLSKSNVPATPLQRYDRKLKQWVRIEIPDWKMGIERVEKKRGLIHPVAIDENSPIIDSLDSKKSVLYGFLKVFGHQHHKDRIVTYLVRGEERKVNFTDCPAKFIQGVAHELSKAWEGFLAGRHSRPRFKTAKDKVMTLIHYNAKDLGVKDSKVNIPKLGYIEVIGFDKRWYGCDFNPMKICKKASGWYVQLTASVPVKQAKKTGLCCGIDPGHQFIMALDNGHTIEAAQPLKRSLKRLRKMQQQLSRKYRMNEGKTKNWEKLNNKIAKLHEKIARHRRSFNHWHSTNLINWFDVIFVEDYKPANVYRKAKAKAKLDTEGNPVVAENGTVIYDKNSQKRKRGSNRTGSDVAIGQAIDLLETKAKEHGKLVIRVDNWGTTLCCAKCGHQEKKKLSQRTHKCSNCGYTVARDVNSGQNIKLKGLAQMAINQGVELSDNFWYKFLINKNSATPSCSKKATKKKTKKSDTITIPDDLFKNGVHDFLVAETAKTHAIINQMSLGDFDRNA
jgi:putative transposase